MLPGGDELQEEASGGVDELGMHVTELLEYEGGEADDERRVIRVADRHRHFNGIDILENEELTGNWLRVPNNIITATHVLMKLRSRNFW